MKEYIEFAKERAESARQHEMRIMQILLSMQSPPPTHQHALMHQQAPMPQHAPMSKHAPMHQHAQMPQHAPPMSQQ